MAQLQVQKVLHYPRLDTVMMVEDAIRRVKDYPSRMELWRSLGKQVQYQTFQLILEYLQSSNKIFITKEGKIQWVFVEGKAQRKLLRRSVPYARNKALGGVQ